MTFQERVAECVAEIKEAAAEMGDGFDKDIAHDSIWRHGKQLSERDQDYLHTEVMFHVQPYQP